MVLENQFRKEHIMYIFLFVVYCLEIALLFGSLYLKNISIIYIILTVLFITITAFKMTFINDIMKMIQLVLYSAAIIVPFALYSSIFTIYETKMKNRKKGNKGDSFLTTAGIMSSIIFIFQTVIYTYSLHGSADILKDNQNMIYHLLQLFLFIINSVFGGFILRDLYFYHTDG